MKKQKFSFTYLAILLTIMLLVLSKINVRTVEGFTKLHLQIKIFISVIQVYLKLMVNTMDKDMITRTF